MQKLLLPLFCVLFSFQAFAQHPKVLIIGIDGCRPDALTTAHTPNLDALMASGIFSLDALNDGITISGPGWSDILTGVGSDKHGVTDNSFNGANYDQYPHFFKRLEDYDPNFHTVSFCHWGPINNQIVQDHADFKLNVSTDLEVASQAAAYLAVNDPDAMFLHFDDVDHAGHASGFSPEVPEYIAAIESVDAHVGTVMAAITGRPIYAEEKWLILATTDHGGLGFSHGGTSFEEQNVFVIASGDHLPAQEIQKDSTVTIIALPENCLDIPVELVFDGANDQAHVPENDLFAFGAERDFTIECRVRTDVAGDVNIVGNKNWDSGLNPGFILSFKYPAGPEWKVNIGDGSNRADINTGGLIADGEWHTLSVTFDRDGYMVMYEDGQAIDSADISNIGNINVGEGLFFGNDFTGGYAYSGALAEVRVWDKALAAAEVQSWFCSALTEAHPDYGQLLGYWKVDDGPGATQLADYSPYGNTATITGAQWQMPDTIQVEYDYSNTPRLPDVTVSALTHLCVPIEAAWELDGHSLVPECAVNSTEGLALAKLIEISPVPAQDYLQVTFAEAQKKEVEVCLYNVAGQQLDCRTTQEPTLRLDTPYQAGVYWLSIRLDGRMLNRKVVIGR